MEQLAELVRTKLGTQEATRTPKLGGESKTSLQGNRALSAQASLFLQLPDTERTAASAMVVSSAWYPLVGTAALELAYAPLHEQIREFASVALSAGCNQLQLLPLFLLPGVHVTEDIPAEVALAQESLGQAVVMNLRPHLGAHPGLRRMLASQLATVDADAKILLSHGTRRPGGNESVEAVAEYLGAVAAYWSVSPTLEEQLLDLASAGHKQIAILPYFLFSGGITDAIAKRCREAQIAQSVSTLQERFPKLKLSLCAPIGVSSQLADLIVDLTRD
jgi:sirohydrochlorin ferrochelatase